MTPPDSRDPSDPDLTRPLDPKAPNAAPSDDQPTVPLGSKPDAPPRSLPERIGQYRIISKLGEGGMGVVYEAEQQGPKRTVAVKVVRGGEFVDDLRLHMFRREAETLGRLKHPHIAAIYESGRTDDGQHFFAMELVQGQKLDDYLRSLTPSASLRRTDLRHRLEIFREIVEAVHYAHQRGVIHRDLKPSNILVAADDGTGPSTIPTVKILDFGLARITDTDVQATMVSEIGMVKGTLPYMSPEQARGNPDEIDVRTDVYSLGVILHEMVFGSRPYDVESASIPEAIRIICEERPAAQRARASQDRRIDVDVGTICLKALEKDPERRYASAAALADDVQRFLTNRTILARPPSRIYEFRKMVARNRIPVVLACTLFVLAVGSAITMGFLWQGQREARLRTEAEANRTQRVNTFLQGMLESVSPDETRGEEVTVRYLLDGAVDRAAQELGDDPDIHSEIQQTLGRTYCALAVYDAADSLLERALEIRRDVFGQQSLEVSSALNDLALLRWDTGDLEGAETLYREAVAVDRHLGLTERVATDLNNLGGLLREAGKIDDAESVLRETLETKRGIYGSEHVEVAQGLHNLGLLMQLKGDLETSESLVREALAMTSRLRGDDHPEVNVARSNLANILRDLGRADEAAVLLGEVLETARRIYGDQHPIVGTAFHNLGWALYQSDKKEDALAAFREALRVRRDALGEDHFYVAQSLSALARGLQDTGNPAEARSHYEHALSLQRDLVGSRHPETLITMVSLSRCLIELGEIASAERFLGEAAVTGREALGDHPITGVALSLHGQALIDLDRLEEAEAELLEAQRILELVYGDTHPRTQGVAGSLATLYERQGRSADAAKWRELAGGIETSK